ncbi:MAG TPA: heterodisulfide reductase-related iron-sulfur binding cluster [Dehalococcoidales bacterium]|nr:heterodisulfide reductase-related iron-sulfur binding cluster [Dehalococcoidales bacterium]
MLPGREIFWNVPFGDVVLYSLTVVVIGILLYAFYRRYRLWRLGGPSNRFNHLVKRTWAFIVTAIIDGIFHRKFFGIADGLEHRGVSMENPLSEGVGSPKGGFLSLKNFIWRDFYPRELYPGITHFLILAGCGILLLGAFTDFISHYFFHFMHGYVYLGHALVVDVGGMMVAAGAILAIIRRYAIKPDRLDNMPQDLIALILICVVVFFGFILEGLRIAITNPSWAPWSPGGYVLSLAFGGLSENALLATHRFIWWVHILTTLGAIVYVSLYFNRLWHIIISPLNVFFKSLEPKGALVPIDLEAVETFGAGKIENFSWKQLMDLDACTRCGRCQDNCPAYLSSKPLSPKKVVQDLKATWLAEAPRLLHAGKKKENPGDEGQALPGEVVTEDEIWSCTTCRACQEVCPVCVEPMVKVVELRRNLVMEQAVIPETGEGALKSIEDRGHPWRGTTLTRTDWAQGLDIKTLAEDSEIDILFWVGCTEALEDRSVRIAQAVGKILKLAGIKFGILGIEESCCGDPARRLGNEYLFQLQAEKNIEILKNYNVKKIVTACPHCYNTLKNEYPQFGGEFEVIHHTELITDLLKEDKLRILKGNRGVVTYHDSCYLGRHNDIYEPPRQILKGISDITVVEMERNKERGFCCGGGGGHMWLEERIGKRISEMRIEQVLETRAEIVATACPYCLQMFDDAIKAKAVEESLKVIDIAELVAQSALYRPYHT